MNRHVAISPASNTTLILCDLHDGIVEIKLPIQKRTPRMLAAISRTDRALRPRPLTALLHLTSSRTLSALSGGIENALNFVADFRHDCENETFLPYCTALWLGPWPGCGVSRREKYPITVFRDPLPPTEVRPPPTKGVRFKV
ncbi:hypothetical protein EVAR_32081_1 [Eumeta japonica]|uniref:Uncharacterized protein n=1 Tax=Eumeta variegata TaxID=151549 RepID=A0A4C1V444_EUMVA|nr:hypothetical protein EVAR_32081_1 [Eumeta japonica]